MSNDICLMLGIRQQALPADRRLLQAKTVTGILRTKYCKQLSEDILHKELQLVLDLLVKEGKVCIKSSFYEWIRVGWSDTQLDPIHNLVKEGWRLNQAYSPHIGKEFRLFYESNRWLDGHIIGILPKYGGNMPSTWYLFQDDFSHDHPIAIPEDILQPLLSYQQETCIPQSIFDKLYRFYPKLLDWIVQLRMDLFGNHVVLCLVKTGFLLMAFDGLDSAAITLNIKKTKIIDHFVSGEFHGCVKFEILKRSIWLEKIKTEGMVRNVDLAVLRCLLDPATASYYTEGYPFPTEKDDLIRFRQTNGWNSLVDCSSLQGDLLRRFHGPSHAAEVLEISPNGILQAIQQRTAYAGFYWQYTVSSKDKHGNIVSSKKSLYVPVLILRAMMVVGESKLIKSNCTASIPTSFSTAPTNLITNDSTNEDSKSGVDNKLCYRVGCYSVDGVLLYVFSNPLVAAQSVLGNVSVILLSAYHWHLSCAHRGFLWKFEEMNTPSTASPTTLHLEHLLSFANFPLQGLDPKHVFRVHTDAELEAIESNNAKNKGKSIENTSNNVYLEGMTAHPFIGLKVRRFFSGSFSDGMVKTFLPAERNDGIPFWHIRHDDNDEEDLELLEVLESLYYIRHQVRDKRVRWSLALGRSSLNANDNFIGGSAFQDQLFLELKRRPLQEIVDAFSMEDIHQRLCKDIPVQLCTNLTNQSDGKILMLLYNLIHQISQTVSKIQHLLHISAGYSLTDVGMVI